MSKTMRNLLIDRLAVHAARILPGLNIENFKRDVHETARIRPHFDALLEASLTPIPGSEFDMGMIKGVIMVVADATGGNPAAILNA